VPGVEPVLIKRLVESIDLRPRRLPTYPASRPMITITTSSSRSVKPPGNRLFVADDTMIP